MSRLDFFTIAIVAVCIGALAILIVRVVKLTGEGDGELATTEAIDDYDQYFEDSNADVTFEEEPESESPEGDYVEDNTEGLPKESKSNEAAADVVEEESFTEDASEAIVEEPAEVVPEKYEPTLGNSDGAFMVIAGSFSLRENADAYADKIRAMGYSNVSVAQFNKGKINAVLVDRYQEKREALAAVRELKKEHGVNAYIQEKK